MLAPTLQCVCVFAEDVGFWCLMAPQRHSFCIHKWVFLVK
jgi:hypothetical protein